MPVIKVGDVYTWNGRTLIVTKVLDLVIHYAETYGKEKEVFHRVTSRIGWENDVAQGELVLVRRKPVQ